MSKVQMLRALVKQRLTAAEFEQFERTIAEYEEEVCRLREENERLQKLLDAAFSPQLQSHRAVFPAVVQQLLVVKEDVPSEVSKSLDQEDPEPPHIKEEQEELWTGQEGEQLQELEEADIMFTFTPVLVKSEEDEEKPQSSQLHQRQSEQMEPEADGEDCGGPEPDRNSDPDIQQLMVVKDEVPPEQQERTSSLDQEDPELPHIKDEQEELCGGPEAARNTDPDTHFQPDTDDTSGESSEPETDDSDDWKEIRGTRSGLNSLIKSHVPISDSRFSSGEKPFSCSWCEKRFGRKGDLKRHIDSHTGEKPFSCSWCEKRFGRKGDLKRHIDSHTGEKPFSCSVCRKCFTRNGHLQMHMKIHTGEKPFSCSVCGKGFIESGNLKKHMRCHTGEKPFSCSICKKSFTHSGSLQMHVRIHTGEKPFSCSICKTSFTHRVSLHVHMRIHTGEKPFSCSICKTSFTHRVSLHRHMRIHSEVKPFSCSVCAKGFIHGGRLKKHMKIHTGQQTSSQQLN